MKSLKEALFSRKNMGKPTYHIKEIVELLNNNESDLLILSENGPQFYTHELHSKGTPFELLQVHRLYLYVDRQWGLIDDGVCLTTTGLRTSLSRMIKNNSGIYLLDTELSDEISKMISSFNGQTPNFNNINNSLLKMMSRSIPEKQYKEIEIIK